jgi:hypothetical protein
MINLYSLPQTSYSLQQACLHSSVARTETDIAAGGGIVFETAFEKAFNSFFSEEFPYRVFLKQDLDLIELIQPDLIFDWGSLGSKDQLLKNINTEWTEQSNADFIFFKVEGDKYTFVDAWSNKTTVAVDLIDALEQNRPKGVKVKKTSKLDLVNVKTELASELIQNYSTNYQTELNMGRCLLTISNNGVYSSYFWDGRLSSILNCLNENSASITSTDKEVQCKISNWPKKVEEGKKDTNPTLMGCSNRKIVEGQQSTSFGRSLWICASGTKTRSANFMAEKLSDLQVFERVSSGSINLKDAILDSLRTRLNLKTEEAYDNAA